MCQEAPAKPERRRYAIWDLITEIYRHSPGIANPVFPIE
jgi:hypothetical protein